jgi:hypothetical protein
MSYLTPGDIVRAIEGVEKAGLQVYRVEITRPAQSKSLLDRAAKPARLQRTRDSRRDKVNQKATPSLNGQKQTRRVRCFDPIIACRRHGRSVPTVIRPSWTPPRAAS